MRDPLIIKKNEKNSRKDKILKRIPKKLYESTFNIQQFIQRGTVELISRNFYMIN